MFVALTAMASLGACSVPGFYDRPNWSLFDKAEVAKTAESQVATTTPNTDASADQAAQTSTE